MEANMSMSFGALVTRMLETVDVDELRDAAVDLADHGLAEDDIVAGLAKLVDKAVPADLLLAGAGPVGAVAGTIVERYDEAIAAALLRPLVRLAMDPEHRAHWKAARAERRAARAARRAG